MTTNQAFVFIKPHAVTDAVKELVQKGLEEKGITILSQGEISSEEIDSKKLIDQHYYAIASKATILKPSELNVPEDKFKDKFGLEWKDALASGTVFNAMDACEKLGLDAAGIDAVWGKAKKADKLIKFGGGFYCGLLDTSCGLSEGQEPIYVFNAFFMSMRSKFTAPGLKIYYYTVEFDPATLAWEDFRGKVLGPTDPKEAPGDSLRGKILADYSELGLTSEPNTGDNGVHASASPFEGLAERMNWLNVEDPAADKFGKKLIEAGVDAATIKAWSVDPVVPYPEGMGKPKGSLFDALEDTDADACIEKCKALKGAA